MNACLPHRISAEYVPMVQPGTFGKELRTVAMAKLQQGRSTVNTIRRVGGALFSALNMEAQPLPVGWQDLV